MCTYTDVDDARRIDADVDAELDLIPNAFGPERYHGPRVEVLCSFNDLCLPNYSVLGGATEIVPG